MLRKRLYQIIFYADTKEGKFFDIALLVLISISIILVMLESVESIGIKYVDLFNYSEWVVTILFTIEYFLRIAISKKPLKYIFSTLGIIDLLSLLPKYLSFFFVGSNALLSLRALRLIRIFRILKLARYVGESNKLIGALKASKAKISVFLVTVMILCIVLGTIMYLVEGAENGFTSIPRSVYWCIVTLTTVGFGDIAPSTPLGQLIASLVMIIGYGIIAVPTGIVSAEYAQSMNEEGDDEDDEVKKDDFKPKKIRNRCPNCRTPKIKDASFCYVCGESFN